MITGKRVFECFKRFSMTHNADDQVIFDYLVGQNLDEKGVNRKPTRRVLVGKTRFGRKKYRDIPIKISKMYRKMIRSGRIA